MGKKYDVIIIGAGIGGLVSSCYLAKAGLKVLIVEQHDKPGGYCSSFDRSGFSFDIGVHYLGSLGRGLLKKIFNELNLNLKIVTKDPSHEIILPDVTTQIRTDARDTEEEFKKKFPKESLNITNFFNFILQYNYGSIYSKIKKCTFEDVLDDFFQDYKLKATFNLLLGNLGVSAQKASASAAVILLREYILDAGHYPVGGIQSVPIILVQKFLHEGGEIIYSKKVQKILCKNKKVYGVLLVDGSVIFGESIISACDATQTFNFLLDNDTSERVVTKNLKVSPSAFLVYLGLNLNSNFPIKESKTIWYFSNYDINRAFSDVKANIAKDELEWIIGAFRIEEKTANGKARATLSLLNLAPFEDEYFWRDYKQILYEKMIKKFSELVPNLNEYIYVKEMATPLSFFKFTLNREGAIAGWLATREQILSNLIPQKNSIDGLYSAGQWVTLGYVSGAGVPIAAFSGRRVARLVIEARKMKWDEKEILL